MYTLRLCTAAWNVWRSGPHWSPLYIEVWATECDVVARHLEECLHCIRSIFFSKGKTYSWLKEDLLCFCGTETCRLCTHQTWFESSKLNHRNFIGETECTTRHDSKEQAQQRLDRPTSDLHLSWQRERWAWQALVSVHQPETKAVRTHRTLNSFLKEIIHPDHRYSLIYI